MTPADRVRRLKEAAEFVLLQKRAAAHLGNDVAKNAATPV
jgi:hypothetical protein